MSLIKSLFDLGKDAVTIVAKPVEIAVDVTRLVTKPLADAATEIADDIKEELGDDK